MNTVKITQTLKQALVDYLITTFDANKDGKEPELALKIRESFEAPKALFTGPYLELISPYIQAASLRELCQQGLLSKRLLALPCFSLPKPEPIPLEARLYSHQMKAIKKLCEENRSIVISSGTGSGKTECFSIPIVNDLLEDDTPGVRALLVYPLNALVNDQMERLRIMLSGTSITFGRFTSELPEHAVRDERTLPNEIISRDEIRGENKFPQILITNYAMLEYLLLRPEDSRLFNHGLWKYIVLDEAHTYTGAQGIEVAMLLRRLKQRLGKKPGDILCIATSATLVNDNPEKAASFAKKLFSEDFGEDDVIFGDEDKHYPFQPDQPSAPIPPEAYLHPDFEKMLEEMRKANLDRETARQEIPDVEKIALWMEDIGIIDLENLAIAEHFHLDLPGFLNRVLANNIELSKLRNWMIQQDEPVLFEDAARFIFPTLDEMDQSKALYRLIEIGAIARPAPNRLPLLPVKYHIFARPPQGIWACLNPNCVGKTPDTAAKWSRIYSTSTNICESCGAQVYPIDLCRDCGQVYIAAHCRIHSNEYLPAVEQLQEENEKRYFTWSRIEENTVLSDHTDDEDESGEDQTNSPLPSKFQQNEIQLCLSCGKPITYCACQNPVISIPLFDLNEKNTKKKRGQQIEQTVPVSDLQECPRCRSKSKGETEMVTPITIRGTGPLANLTYELYRQLPSSSDPKKKSLPGEGRKLLTFYDSRQGAARFAAFLQDVSNKQNYRHIIPQAIKLCLQDDEWGNSTAPNLFILSKKSGELAWNKGIIQNDPESEYWRKSSADFSAEHRKASAIWTSRFILGEFTTGRRSRQSLESIGLVGVSYFLPDNLPDFAGLGSKIGLSSDQVQALVGYLLDDLRFKKAIKLPTGVHRDDPEFGTNIQNPCVIRQGKPHSGEICWIGETPRQLRRQYIQLALASNHLDSSDEQVKTVLTKVWDWLIQEVDGLLTGSSTVGYQLDPAHIYFNIPERWFRCKKCQRLSYRGTTLPCPYPRCGGELEAVDVTSPKRQNYFYNLFRQPLIPIRVEEHTAQLDSEKGKEYQDSFKAGLINALSCSTTFEMGIDLGDLQAIIMSNVPPTVANYRQRAGRAGRRTSGTAFILTWASNRPHDQTYYDAPIEIISGRIAIPNIMLENELILHRHVNAILLSQFLRYMNQRGIGTEQLALCGDFFDQNLPEVPHYSFLQEWIKEENEIVKGQLQEFANLLPEELKPMIDNGIEYFLSDLRRLNDEHYQPITRYYQEQIRQLADQLGNTAMSPQASQDVSSKLNYYRSLLGRMRGSRGKNSGYLINYLSNNGVLPSYSFPLHTVELMLPREVKNSEHLRLERDLRRAIIEYAPGSEIVADKKVWRSQRPIFWKDTPKVLEYRICENCHRLDISDDAGIPLPQTEGICPVCHSPLGRRSKTRKFVEPDGFIADPNSGKPAKQYVNIEPSQMRSALIPEQNLDEEENSKFIYLAYNQKGRLLYVNEGKFGKGFSFSVQGFSLFSDNDQKDKLSLGHIQTTNTLHIRFVGNEYIQVPSPYDQSFWLSLLYAIIHGASHCLQIERRDIDGVLSPRSSGGSWEQTIVLYDSVPGGAGHVKNIKENLVAVLQEARRILNCKGCEPDTSCPHCLRDYNNQVFYQDLKRESASKFLDLLTSGLIPLDIDVPGAVRIVASDSANWLLEKIRYVQQSIMIAISKLDIHHPKGENYTWLDTLGDLLNRGCGVSLYLQELPEHTPEGYSLATHLQVLMGKGLKVWKISQLPTWQVIIDRDSLAPRIIGSELEKEKIVLEDQIGTKRLLSTTHRDAVTGVVNEWDKLSKTPIKASDLNPPQHVRVINLSTTARSDKTEQSFFSDLFALPCKKLLVHDPYLYSREQIVNRLGAYIAMAVKHDSLSEVVVFTKKHIDGGEQDRAEQEINQKYNGIIRFKHMADHDRYIEITRLNGERAKIIIGRGLDFIQPDGSIRSTYIVIQDPVTD
ncbi:MAG: DEAD/DEAH box helicase [Anaerolineaceae bacterium]|nr:DEAD/DEAH box helicase [Anaerolineaceae bacterium]